MFWRFHISRKFRLRTALGLIAALILMASCTCSTFGTFSDLYAMDTSGGNCDCNGSTLVCTNKSVADSYFCRQTDLNSQGFCQCDGTTLSCTFYICMYTNYGNLINSELYAACDANGNNSLLNESRISKSSSSTTLRFENSDLCKGNEPAIEPVTEPPTEEPTEPPTDTPTPTATDTDTPTPTATHTFTPEPVVTEDVTDEPPAQCEAGWLPDSGCTCCGTTLVCADGTVAQFNPQCMGGPPKPGGTP